MRSPFLTAAPSLNGRATISPNTSGVILTSTSGWILPVAVTTWTMVLVTASSVVTGVTAAELRFLTSAMATSAATSTVAPAMYQTSLDFLRALTAGEAEAFPGERAAVMGEAFTGKGLLVKWPSRAPRQQ